MPNILYLHGFASGPLSQKGRFFHQQFSMIGADVHQPDLAQGDFQALTLSGQLKVVDQAVQELEPALIMGSSLGGYLAALYAASQPERVRSLVLLAPAFGFARRLAEQLGEQQMKAWKEQGTRQIYHYGEQRMLPLGYQFYEDALWHDENPEVTQPTLIIHGRRDDSVDPSLSVEFAWGKNNVDVQLVDSDHQMLDVLPEVWDKVVAFYHRVGPET